jgi:hypothetical protein
MKFNLTLLLTLAVFLFGGCLRDECETTRTYVRFDPVFKTLAEIRLPIAGEGPRALQKPGKMYVLGQYLFINERHEGVHVIDNADPANPQAVAFWRIPGNVDIAIRGNTLYADQYIDLLTIDISNLHSPQLLCRSENVFALHGTDPQRGILVDYVQSEVTEEIPCTDARFNQPWFFDGDVLMAEDNSGGGFFSNSNGAPAASGIAGSYTRFGLVNDYLYVVDNQNLNTFSVAAACPSRLNSNPVGWNIETIFPWKDRLFVGSQNGVFIFNNANPQQPVLESTFTHATGCDPVVCDDDYAYVTIHDGTSCNGTINQLDVIDIRNLPSTALLTSLSLTRPMGLAVTNSHLFVCDDGLKVFDKSNPADLRQLTHVAGIQTYDVIALSQTHLLVIGESGFLQYDVTDPANPKQISLIPVQN